MLVVEVEVFAESHWERVTFLVLGMALRLPRPMIFKKGEMIVIRLVLSLSLDIEAE